MADLAIAPGHEGGALLVAVALLFACSLLVCALIWFAGRRVWGWLLADMAGDPDAADHAERDRRRQVEADQLAAYRERSAAGEFAALTPATALLTPDEAEHLVDCAIAGIDADPDIPDPWIEPGAAAAMRERIAKATGHDPGLIAIGEEGERLSEPCARCLGYRQVLVAREGESGAAWAACPVCGDAERQAAQARAEVDAALPSLIAEADALAAQLRAEA